MTALFLGIRILEGFREIMKDLPELAFITAHENGVFQCILLHLLNFLQVLIENLDFLDTRHRIA